MCRAGDYRFGPRLSRLQLVDRGSNPYLGYKKEKRATELAALFSFVN